MEKSATTNYLTGLSKKNCKERAERFIEENEGILHNISWNIFEKSKAFSTTIENEDVFMDCIIAAYDTFETFAIYGVSVKNNEIAYIAQTIRNKVLESVWDFHKGCSMPFSTMKAKRRETGEIPVEIRPYYGGLMSSFGSDTVHKLELEDMYAVQEALKVLTSDNAPEQAYIKKEEMETLSKANEKLNTKECLVIETIYGRDLSLAKAGEILGETKSSMYSTEQKALKKLRAEYDLIININGRYSQK